MVLNSVFWHEREGTAIFISGLRNTRVDVVQRKHTADVRSSPWPGLEQLGFSNADAWLPVREAGAEHEKYVFYGDSFGRITLDPPTRKVDGPWKIADKITSLGKAGFDTVDAALNVPGAEHEVYFFRGTNYVKIHLKDDRITWGPTSLAKGWPGLTKAGFDTVDTVLEVPGKSDEVLFFRGKKSVTLKVVSRQDDQIVSGPDSILTNWKGAFDWLSKC